MPATRFDSFLLPVQQIYFENSAFIRYFDSFDWICNLDVINEIMNYKYLLELNDNVFVVVLLYHSLTQTVQDMPQDQNKWCCHN